jgi:signal transduction histidine kinase
MWNVKELERPLYTPAPLGCQSTCGPIGVQPEAADAAGQRRPSGSIEVGASRISWHTGQAIGSESESGMNIGTRLVLLLALPLIALVVLFGYLTQLTSRHLIQEELARQGRAFARVVQMTMEDYLRDRQIEDARELVDQITGYERVLAFRLFDREGKLIHESAGQKAGPGIRPEDLARVLHDRKPAETHEVFGGDPVLTFTFPLSNTQGGLVGAVQSHHLETFIDEAARASRRSVAALTAVMILASGVVILLVSRYTVGRPIADLVRTFREAGSGDLRARVPIRRRDEFGRLAHEFNLMCERLEASQRSLIAAQEERRRAEAGLRKAERLASLGRLAAGLAHEIGTPLNVIGGRAEALIRRLKGSEVAERNLRIIASQIARIARIMRGMLDFARAGAPRLAPTEVGSVVRKVLEFLEQRFNEAGVRVEPTLPADLPRVIADPDQLQQVFLNLATNALDAMPRGGTLAVRAAPVERPPSGGEPDGGPFLGIVFEDSGIGIERKILDRIFDPFFSTKDVGKGTGLGLSVSYGIVRDHGGLIEVESETGRGTRVSVFLPLGGAPRDALSGIPESP